MIEIEQCGDQASNDGTAVLFATLFMIYLFVDLIVCTVAIICLFRPKVGRIEVRRKPKPLQVVTQDKNLI